MKKIIILTLFFYGLLTGTIMAGTYRVNNNLVDNPSAKIFSNLQKAHDAASNGDTLIIYGSYKFYDTLVCIKKLFIKGPGYFLDENPGRSINKLSAKVLCIYFNSGSEGTIVTSLEIPLEIVINVSNITIRRCRTGFISIADTLKNSLENITITGCFFNDQDDYNKYHFDFPQVIHGSTMDQWRCMEIGKVTNLNVTNCIMKMGVGADGGVNSTGMFMNNIFCGYDYYMDEPFGWKNNIIEHPQNFYMLYPYGDVCCNVYCSGTFTHDTLLFLGGESPDGKWQNKEGSPAKGAGDGGVDCGPFGGPHPYILSGIEPDTGMVAYYRLNGNGNDASGNGNNGIATDNPLFTEDRFGNQDSAYIFTDDYYHFTNFQIGTNKFPSGNQPRSVSLWYKVPQVSYDTSELFCLIDYGTSIYMCDTCNGKSFGIFASPVNNNDYIIRFDDGGYKLSASHPMKLNTWHHVVITYTGIDLSIYIDGQLDKTVTHPINTVIKEAFIGYWGLYRINQNSYSSSHGKGSLDDIRVYNSALSEDIIKALYDEKAISITMGSKSTAQVGRIFEIPVYTSTIHNADHIISYQFDLKYDSTKLNYVDCNLSNTIAEGGTISVNSGTAGKLNIGYISSSAITGSGVIARLRFKIIWQGNSALTISNFLYNANAIGHLTNGSVSSSYINYGDIDENDKVLAYDAALDLQYSVGFDPIPSIDPLPWESWRIETADVDGVPGITAYDAALILQKSIGLITQFPVENIEKSTLKSKQTNDADIDLKVENNNIVFYSKGELLGLNVDADNSDNILGTPVLLDSTMIMAFNNQNGKYAIGVATAYSPAENTAFMKIPYSKNGSVTFNMIVNSESKSVTVDIPTGIEEFSISNITIYPNPVKDNLTVTGIVKPTVANFYSLDGQVLLSAILFNSTSDISLNKLTKGIYIIKLQTDKEIAVKRFVKQ